MERKIKVLQVIDSLETGGAEKIVYDLAVNLDPLGYDVSICSLEDERETFLAERLMEKGFSIHFLGRKEGFDLSLPSGIRRIIREKSIDIVHCHIGGELYGHAGTVGTRARVLTTLHGIFPYSLKQRALIWLCSIFKKNYKVAVSKELQKLYNCHTLIYNGVDTGSPPPAADGIGEFHRSSDDIVVAITGRLSQVKNHRNFLDAASIVSSRNEKVKFVVVGDGPLQRDLERYCESKGISERTVFTGYRKDIESIMNQIDISVLSSDSEGLPMVVLESMAASKPVVATAVGGIPELVIDDVTGILVEPRDPAALASAIERLAGDGPLRERMGRAARKRIEDNFSTSIMIDKYRLVYGNLLDGRRA